MYVARNIVLSAPMLVWFLQTVIGRGWVDFGGWSVMAGLCDVVLMLAVTDTVFYTVHRLMHSHPVLYRWHIQHHSFNPTQTCSYVAMSLTEFGVEILVYFMLPPLLGSVGGGAVHVASWGLANGIVLVHGVWIHNNVFKWDGSAWGINSPHLHQLHHRHGRKNCNFGLLTTFWDRVFDTLERFPHRYKHGSSMNDWYHGVSSKYIQR